MKTHNILWIDDQYDEQPAFIDDAYQHGLSIRAFKTSRDGIEFLEKNLEEIDGVILDAKVYKDSEDETASLKGLNSSIREIARISGQHQGIPIPYVVFTGQPDLESDVNFADSMDDTPVFSKTGDNKLLFNKLKELIGDSPKAAIRNRYRPVYNACMEGHYDQYGTRIWSLVFPILTGIEGGIRPSNAPYNDLRKALEWIFRRLWERKILHEQLVDGGIILLKLASFFLSGDEARFQSSRQPLQAKTRVFPKLITDNIRYILDVTQPGSHSESPSEASPDKSSIVAVESYAKDHHLLQIVALMLLDVIVWVDGYLAAHPDSKKNATNWSNIPDENSREIGPIDCRIISTHPSVAFASPVDDAEETEGYNFSIEPDSWPTEGLKEGDLVSLSTSFFKKNRRDPSKSSWVANSCVKTEQT